MITPIPMPSKLIAERRKATISKFKNYIGKNCTVFIKHKKITNGTVSFVGENMIGMKVCSIYGNGYIFFLDEYADLILDEIK